MANSSNQKIYDFDGFRLDAAQLMLYRGKQEIFLPRKTVETLVVLIENRGEIVGKDELMDRIWEDAVVEESNLSQYIYQLRKTLGNRANGKPFIETFRRRGYRFNGEVRVQIISSSAVVASVSEAAQVSTAAGYDVARRGNVLKLVERKEAEIQPAETASTNSPALVPLSRKTWIMRGAIAAVVAILVLIPVFLYVQRQLLPTVETRVTAKNELTFIRLTNGSAPMDATISPNGDYFVYHEQDGTIAHLWLQQTGGSSRIEITAPTEKILRGKTFSPDGQFIYFIAESKTDVPNALYRVPVLGGVPVKILDNIGSAVSFSPDGSRMVFHRWDEKEQKYSLVVADSSGGNEKVLLAWTKDQGILANPAWSPGGEQIAFFGYSFPNDGIIYTLNLQTNAVEKLSPESWDTCYRKFWTHDGAGLVFIGTKAGEGHSTRRDQIYYLSVSTGESRRLTTDGNRHQIDSLGVTKRDEILTVPFNRSSQIWQMNANGDARTAVQITGGLADGRAGLGTLPDGRIAYIARIGESLSVWTANADGTNQKQMTYEPPVAEEVRASPDGRFLAFSAKTDENSHLFLMDADGANLRQLTFGNSSDVDSAFSPDGNWIVYSSHILNGGEKKTSLQKIPTSGGAPVLFADMDCPTPNFSPDGKFVSCVYKHSKFAVLSAEDGSVVKMFEPVQVPYFNIGARFSPDERNLIYIARRKNFSNLWRQPVEGGSPQPLTDFTSGELHNFAFSSDGARLYVARGFEVRDVMLIKNFR